MHGLVSPVVVGTDEDVSATVVVVDSASVVATDVVDADSSSAA
jgi:hypothetical protein